MTTESIFSDPLGGIALDRWHELTIDKLYSSQGWLALCAGDAGGTAGAISATSTDGSLAALPVTAIKSESSSFYRWHDLLAEAGLPAPPPIGILAGSVGVTRRICSPIPVGAPVRLAG